MANPTIGKVRCPFTGEWAEVRRYAKGTKKLYFYSGAGMITPNSAVGQNWMRQNTIFDEAAEVVTSEPEPVNEPGTEKPDQKPVKKRKSILEIMMSEDEE